MSNPLIKDSDKIINPFAKPVVTIEVNDRGQVNLNSTLHPSDLCKLLQNISVDVMFKYMDAVAKSKIEDENFIKN